MNRIALPGATIGVLGSGQLGRMMALEARRMGYRVHTLSPGVDTPTGQVADLEVSAEFDDVEAIRTFARGVDVMTFEFENVSTDAADAASRSGRADRRCTSRSNARARKHSSPIVAIRLHRLRKRSRSTSWPSASAWSACR